MRLIFIRHGESESNINKTILSTKPDCSIALTDNGKDQAYDAGAILKREGVTYANFYVSPFLRAKETYQEIIKNIRPLNFKEDIRLREVEIGNFIKNPKEIHEERVKHSRFFYRFPNGESCADVFLRVKQFLFEYEKELNNESTPIIFVTHAATIRVFQMILYNLTVEEFEKLPKPKNGEIIYI